MVGFHCLRTWCLNGLGVAVPSVAEEPAEGWFDCLSKWPCTGDPQGLPQRWTPLSEPGMHHAGLMQCRVNTLMWQLHAKCGSKLHRDFNSASVAETHYIQHYPYGKFPTGMPNK